MTQILITGGAGFIGVHLARKLLSLNYEVAIIDNFNPQVHDRLALPDDLRSSVQLIVEDVCETEKYIDLIKLSDHIVHLAAETGTGQSMYETKRYFKSNVEGTDRLINAITLHACNIKSLTLGSSRAIYGEGSAVCPVHGSVAGVRSYETIKLSGFEPLCKICKKITAFAKTKETSTPQPLSYYALSKLQQENIFKYFKEVSGIKTNIFRFQNVVGMGQSLKNPYTGILSIFAQLAKQGEILNVFEDGNESRDFIDVEDIVNCITLSIHECVELDSPCNVGTGKATSILTVANLVNNFFGSKSTVNVTGQYREGDIRHAAADMTYFESKFGEYKFKELSETIKDYLIWVSSQDTNIYRDYQKSITELSDRNLIHKI